MPKIEESINHLYFPLLVEASRPLLSSCMFIQSVIAHRARGNVFGKDGLFAVYLCLYTFICAALLRCELMEL